MVIREPYLTLNFKIWGPSRFYPAMPGDSKTFIRQVFYVFELKLLELSKLSNSKNI